MSGLAEFAVYSAAFGVLFVLPGIGITLLLSPRDDLDWFERLPLGFVLSLGVLLGPLLLARFLAWDWSIFQWVYVVVASLSFLAGITFWFWRSRPSPVNFSLRLRRVIPLVLTLLVFLSGILTIFTARDEDDWDYFQIIRGIADTSRFDAIVVSQMRVGLSVWWSFQAFLVHVFNLDIVRVGRDYAPLLLVPLAMLALYTLAKTLFADEKKAVLTCAVQLVLYGVDLFYSNVEVQLTGGWVLGRIDQDHTAAQFIFLPIYMMLVIRYLRTGQVRWLGASFVVLATAVMVHPQVLVQVGVAVAGFLFLYLLTYRRRQVKRAAALVAPFAIVAVLLLPFVRFWYTYLQTVSSAYDLSTLARGHSTFPFIFRWVMFLSPTQFIISPSLLVCPVVLLALLLIPLAILDLRTTIAAPYLLGLVLCWGITLYVPFVFVPLSSWIGWGVYRLWYLFPSALLIVFAAPRLLAIITQGLAQIRRRIVDRRVGAMAMCVAGLILVASCFPAYPHGMSTELAGHGLPPGSGELWTALRDQAGTAGGVVLAPTAISDPIPSYALALHPVAFRYYTSRERLDDLAVLYNSKLLTFDLLTIIAKYKTSYVVVPTDREIVSQFDLSPGYFTRLYRNPYWALYRVIQPVQADDLVRANTIVMSGDWQEAVDTYNSILAQAPDDSLAHSGLGMLLELLEKPKKAALELERAVEIAPTNTQAHYHLAHIYRDLGMEPEANAHMAAAGMLARSEQ